MHFSSFYAALALLLLSTVNLASPIPVNNGNASVGLFSSNSSGNNTHNTLYGFQNPAVSNAGHFEAFRCCTPTVPAYQFLTRIGFPTLLKEFVQGSLATVKKTVVTSDSRGTSFVQVLVDKLPSATPARVGASQWTPLSSQGGTRAFSVSDAGTVFNVVFRTK